MRITTKAVWQMTDTGMVLIQRESFDYQGPVAHAGGGSSRSATSSSQATNTQNLNLQEIDGVAVAGVDGSVRIESTDQGSVEAARDIAIDALDVGMSGFQENVDFAGDVVSGSQSLTRDVIDSGRSTVQDSLDFASGVIADDQVLTREVLDTSRGNFQDSIDFAGDVLAGSQSQSRDVLAAGLEFGRSAENLAGDAFAFAERQGTEYAGFVRDSAGDAFDFAGDAQARSFDAVAEASQGFNETIGGITSDFLQGGQALVADVIEFASGAGDKIIEQTAAIQARESSNTDARLQDITRVALIGGAVVAGLAIWAAARN